MTYYTDDPDMLRKAVVRMIKSSKQHSSVAASEKHLQEMEKILVGRMDSVRLVKERFGFMTRGQFRIGLTPPSKRKFGIGNFVKGNVLIVGEQPARAHLGINTPFSEMKGCSGWLNRLLDLNYIPEEELFWCNALNNEYAFLDIKSLVRQLRPSHVMTLGNVPHQLCEKKQIPHERFYHPQYWKRFKSKQPYPFITRLAWIIAEKNGRELPPVGGKLIGNETSWRMI